MTLHYIRVSPTQTEVDNKTSFWIASEEKKTKQKDRLRTLAGIRFLFFLLGQRKRLRASIILRLFVRSCIQFVFFRMGTHLKGSLLPGNKRNKATGAKQRENKGLLLFGGSESEETTRFPERGNYPLSRARKRVSSHSL